MIVAKGKIDTWTNTKKPKKNITIVVVCGFPFKVQQLGGRQGLKEKVCADVIEWRHMCSPIYGINTLESAIKSMISRKIIMVCQDYNENMGIQT